jgi:hypothetical protein
MSQKHRLKKLEKSLGNDKGHCPECHFKPGTVVSFEIICQVHGGDRLQMPADTKLCTTCGRPSTVVIMECDCDHQPGPELSDPLAEELEQTSDPE